MTAKIPDDVIAHWPELVGRTVEIVSSGLINDTFLVGGPRDNRVIVQRLHRVFDETIIIDIQAVTQRLVEQGVVTPELVLTAEGQTWVGYEGEVWRALTYIAGVSHEFVGDAGMAREAGSITARFHSALVDFDYEHKFSRGSVHDTARHLDILRTALAQHREHFAYSRVARVAAELLRESDSLVNLSGLPFRQAHGDLKISNILFNNEGRAICLIDLDTLAEMSWPLEMGDALRSWCNPRPEDERSAALDLTFMEMALAGYNEHAPGYLTAEEKAALVPGLCQITLELTARFLADALNESYFAWDPTRYGSRSGHNQARARAMWVLYGDIKLRRGEAEQLVRDRLG